MLTRLMLPSAVKLPWVNTSQLNGSANTVLQFKSTDAATHRTEEFLRPETLAYNFPFA